MDSPLRKSRQRAEPCNISRNNQRLERSHRRMGTAGEPRESAGEHAGDGYLPQAPYCIWGIRPTVSSRVPSRRSDDRIRELMSESRICLSREAGAVLEGLKAALAEHNKRLRKIWSTSSNECPTPKRDSSRAE